MDDDVQYLGTKLAATEHIDGPCEVLLSVTGITLHVEKCGDKPAHDLSFYRARSACVNIGRKSGSDDKSMRRENDDHNAVFACQVVSARHAKLVLSDSGQVYIVDLHSRHGTHLLRRGETTPRTLQAEVETLLADGDVLTFGKVVGAGSYHVSPVTARVELLTGHSSSEPDEDCTLSPFLCTSPVLPRPRKLSSGRYGLITSSCIESDSVHSSSSVSVSDDAASSPSEQESDVEDDQACVPAIFHDTQSKLPVKIPAFRSFIHEIYHHSTLQSPVILDEPFEDGPGSPSCTDAARQPSPVIVIIEPLSKSRSHSPMEVATPSRPPTPSGSPSPPSEPEQLESVEPAIIGAWPTSRPESPRQSSLELETGRPEMLLGPELDREPEPQLLASPAPCLPRIATLPNDELIELMRRLPPPPFFPIGGPFSNSIASDFGLPSVPPPPPPVPYRMPPFHQVQKAVTECVSTEIKGSLKSVEDRLAVLQGAVNDLRSRQSVTEDDMADLQNQVEMLEPDSELLLCRINGAERNIASLSTLQGQMTTLQNQMMVLRERVDVPEPKPVESPMQDVRACADALNDLVSEMKLLREDVEKRIEAKMDVIQTARTEAMDALREVVIEAQSMRSSSKRKRDSEDAEETTDENVTLADVTVPELPISQVPSPQAPPSPVLEAFAPEVSAPPPQPSRPRKRARTAMYLVAQTAAAMAIGAAATWSALAFS